LFLLCFLFSKDWIGKTENKKEKKNVLIVSYTNILKKTTKWKQGDIFIIKNENKMSSQTNNPILLYCILVGCSYFMGRYK